MTGSKMTSTTTDKMRAARKRGESKTDVAKVRARTPYVWDGKSEDDRPLTREEMQAGIEAYRRRRGRPAGSDKESTTIRFDRDILAAFRAAGPGWQTRMNAALRDWLKTHSPV
ncbi:MAG: BrnA antitoxin family protein [Nevskia sp.]|nr:BrnA antitoxin family protein [Nevskia sp.]